MLYPQQNEIRNLFDLSGVWDFQADPRGAGETERWHLGVPDARPIAVPGSWNEQYADLYNYLGRGLVRARVLHAPRLEGTAHLRARRLGQLRRGGVGQRAEGGRARGRPSALRMRHHRHRRVGRAEHAGDPRGERAQTHARARRQYASQGRRRDGADGRLSQQHLRFLPLCRAAPAGVALCRPADTHHRHRRRDRDRRDDGSRQAWRDAERDGPARSRSP